MTFTILIVLDQLIEVSCRMLRELFQTSHQTLFLLGGPIPCHPEVTHGMSRHSVWILLVEAKERWQRMPYNQWKCGVVKVHDVVLCACPCKRCESKVVLVGRNALMCTLKYTEFQPCFSMFFFPVILVS